MSLLLVAPLIDTRIDFLISEANREKHNIRRSRHQRPSTGIRRLVSILVCGAVPASILIDRPFVSFK